MKNLKYPYFCLQMHQCNNPFITFLHAADLKKKFDSRKENLEQNLGAQFYFERKKIYNWDIESREECHDRKQKKQQKTFIKYIYICTL